MKLVQKHFLKGKREFEIVDDAVSVRLKSAFKEKELTVMLKILNPEPVVNGPFLEFHSRVKCDPLVSLLIDKPNAEAFNVFVSQLKKRARAEYNAFAGLRSGSMPAGLAANVYEEPPEFDDPVQRRADKKAKPVNVANINDAIQMLQRHLDAGEIAPLLSALEALGSNPEDEASFDRLSEAFDAMGHRQGAVLTYAPYVSILLSDDPFGY